MQTQRHYSVTHNTGPPNALKRHIVLKLRIDLLTILRDMDCTNMVCGVSQLPCIHLVVITIGTSHGQQEATLRQAEGLPIGF